MLHSAFTLEMAQVLKYIYENIGEKVSSNFLTKLASVAGNEKELATEYLQIEHSSTLHRNDRFRGNHYRKLKPFSHCMFYKQIFWF